MPAKRSVIESSADRLISWLAAREFQGHDPHDALNSPVLGWMARRSRWVGVALVQALRLLPVNVRPLLRVRVGHNPKAMGLFLSAFLRRYVSYRDQADLGRVSFFSQWLRDHISPGYSGACWGYNFDWPNRGFSAPAGTPTVVNSVFIANAFLDMAASLGDGQALDLARSTCDFVLRDLHRHEGDSGICFSYTPLDRRWVHNANLLAAALLARMGAATGETHLLETATRAAAFSAMAQRPDGSWPYGVARADGWADNFHTAFVLVALAEVMEFTGEGRWTPALDLGYHYWRGSFFQADGAPKYYHGRLHPIDIHCAAEATLAFLRLRDRYAEAEEWSDRVLFWTVRNMQDREGYFHYRIEPLHRIRIPYIRWSQAWMLRAMAEWLWGKGRSRAEMLN